jgi:hypothetical protein
LGGAPHAGKVMSNTVYVGNNAPQPTITRQGKDKVKLGPYSQIPELPAGQGAGLTDFGLSDLIPGGPDKRYTEKLMGPSTVHNSIDPRNSSKFGDYMTMLPITKNIDKDAEKVENGAPFYFKDLRDGSYIYFRGYIESLNENYQPNWSEESYLGRSENVYSYERTSRDLSFSLKMFANTWSELHMLYDKIEKLTSMVYPQWMSSPPVGKFRGKPPLLQFRLGELFGRPGNELLGFIRSLTYSYPDNSTWETIQGSRVPKFITCAITLQILHKDAPGMYTKFHGMNLSNPIHQLDEENTGGDSVTSLSEKYPDTIGINKNSYKQE